MRAEAVSPFGRALRAYRLAAGLSQEALAERSGISADAVAALERGRRRTPRPHTVLALAAALGLGDAERARLAGMVGGSRSAPLAVPRGVHPMIGRDGDRAEVAQLLTGRGRLVTLIGPGGVGKTRLALAVAHDLVEAGGCPVQWVPLGTLLDPDALPATVAAALGVPDLPNADRIDSLADRLAGGPIVLVLDNCEHVVEAAAYLCAELVARTDRVRILATSRERLRVPGEIIRTVVPLLAPRPGTGAGLTADALDRWPATRLFLERARDVAPDLVVDAGTAAHIAQVCRLLDGLPLAIELAAARMGVITAGQLSAELAASLRLLSDGPRTAPDRHRTVHAAIRWSYDLLEPEERTVLARLSAASGGWTLDAAQHFAAGGSVAPGDVLDIITRLVRKSLIMLRVKDGVGRYAILRVIGLFAWEQLEASGELPQVCERHSRYYSELAERAGGALRGPEQQRSLERLDAEADNLRAVIRHQRKSRWADAALRTATALWRFAYLRGRYAEGREALDGALEIADVEPDTDPALRAQALVAAGVLAHMQCEYGLAHERVTAGLEVYRTLGDPAGIADALQRLGSIAREQGAYEQATALHEEGLALWRSVPDPVGIGEALNYLGFVAWLTGETDRAQQFAIEALDRFRGVEAGEGVAWALLNLGVSARFRGDLDDADRALRDSLERCDRLGYLEGTAWCLDQLGALARTRGDLDIAWDLQQESLALHAQIGDRWRASSVLDGLAATAGRRARYDTAAQLAGAAQTLRSVIGTPLPPCERPEHDATTASAQSALGPREYARLASSVRPERLLVRLADAVDVEAALV